MKREKGGREENRGKLKWEAGGEGRMGDEKVRWR